VSAGYFEIGVPLAHQTAAPDRPRRATLRGETKRPERPMRSVAGNRGIGVEGPVLRQACGVSTIAAGDSYEKGKWFSATI